MSDVTIILPKSVARRLQEEAQRLGMTSEELLIELITQGLDPRDKAKEYIGAAEELVQHALDELRRGDVRRAAEKLWGAVALAVKAYAWWKDGRRLSSHGELWEYKRRIVRELGDWVNDAWYAGQSMHICFYEEWCTEEDVLDAYKRIEKLVQEIASKITKGSQ